MSANNPLDSNDEPALSLRLRHIRSIHIRNLTPFHARDSLTSALATKNDPTALAISDDLDVGVLRRKRRVSSVQSITSSIEDSFSSDSSSKPIILARNSRFGAANSRPSRNSISSGYQSSIRSSMSIPYPGTQHTKISASWTSLNCQSQIERILDARLVETFLTIESDLSPSPTVLNELPSRPDHPAFISTDLVPSVERIDTFPFYLSELHYPSTNPSFDNIEPAFDFANWVDPAASDLRIVMWGRILVSSHMRASEWQILSQWSFSLNQLRPLSMDTRDVANLGPNTLCIRFDNAVQMHFLPPIDDVLASEMAENVSDTEDPSYIRDSRFKTLVLQRSLHETKMKKGVKWADLLNMISIQSLLTDIKESIAESVRGFEAASQTALVLLERTISETKEQLRQLRRDARLCRDASDQTAGSLASKRKDLQLRRRNMERVRAMQLHSLSFEHSSQLKLASLHHEQKAIDAKLLSRRGSLFASLTTIFPIELLSASDLLYSVLDIPLPIPVAPTDPAPPLRLATVSHVNEESTASAFAHIAQIVQLAAAYLGQTLPYPITCVGSFSNIKDPISFMMGPRKFPLYTKSVETYRFEYAVYLLNKDVESLMANRDLKAMDMRHTLPNLKNLLLTVSTGYNEDTGTYKLTPKLPRATGSEAVEITEVTETTKVDPSTSRWRTNPFGSTWSVFKPRHAFAEASHQAPEHGPSASPKPKLDTSLAKIDALAI